MVKASKISTLAYVFLLTVVPQLVVWAALGSVLYFAYYFAMYNSSIHGIFGAGAFVAMLFAFLCVAIFCKSYGLSLFAKTRRDFDVNQYHGEPIEKIEYRFGRKNTFTGERSVYVHKREEPTGGPLLVTALMSIVIGLTGIFKFIIEGIRVCLSDDRQAEWEGCREYLIEKRDAEGTKKFFKTPIIVGLAFLLVWAICLPSAMIIKGKYSPEHISFEITEKRNSENNSMRVHVLYDGEVINTGKAKIKQIEGHIYFRDRDGNLLFEDDRVVINVPFSVPSPDDDYLEKNERWEVSFSVLTAQGDEGGQKIWDSDFGDVEISMDVTEISYKGDKFIEFPDEDIIIIKPIN